MNRGSAWVEKKEFDKAINDYNEAIRLDPTLALARFVRGDVWSAKKEYDKAIDDYTEAVRLDPKYALAYSKLASLLATCPDKSVRDGKQAVLVATRTCELTQWKNANDLDTLAAAYAEVGRFRQGC